MICISSRLDEIADIWIRRIIKAIRLQLNCFSRSGGSHLLYVSREVGSQGQGTTSVCVRACVNLCQAVCGAVHHTSRPVI